ncbi:hypothetical protein DDZ18_02410 [Marinicauda salina]|uniref:Uncharacterized protein n=1 Tax=Marinicauda salina TaxID=2135793 RepID=A0A2U2BWV3_9PROT|nr:hypothetical protein [Marinicauda salina]PWE18477.1 hypothetical protein DDZ18_02410 [Marinicauda salina]
MNAERRTLTAVYCLAGLLGLGALFVVFGATFGMSRYVYTRVDLVGFAVVILLAMGLAAFARAAPAALVDRVDRVRLDAFAPWRLAVAVIVLAVIGTHLVQHGYAFSMDEHMTRFQGAIFAEGRLAGEVPPEWREYGRAMCHVFVRYDPETGLVMSDYRPGMASLFAMFDLVGLGLYVSAFMTAGSVLLAAAVARRIWPERPDAAIVAALLVATSQQALAAATTSYAMSAHLCFNLAWIWLFLRGGRLGHGLAPFVGVATASLHQIHFHAFFALPFLLTFLRPLRPGLIAWYGAVYLAGHLAILGWDDFAMRSASETAQAAATGAADPLGRLLSRLAGFIRFPGPFELGTVTANIARFFAWQSLALVPLLVMLRRRAEWSPVMVLLAASIGTSLMPYPLLMPDQGHGWGYRYLHGLIGNFALLGAAGWVVLSKETGRAAARYRAVVLAALAATAFILVPMRAFQIERVAGAWAQAADFVASREAEVVVVDSHAIYYGHDLPRNDPFARNRPIAMDIRALPKDRIDALCGDYSVAFVSGEDVAGFGVPVFDPAESEETPADYPDWVARLTAPDCAAPPDG